MKRLHLLWAVPCLGFVLAGCGTQVPLSGKAFDNYMKSIKPTIHYWEKPGMTVEGRRADWVGCGGMPDGGYTPDARLPGETDDFAAMRRKRERLHACMEMKGYRFSREN